MSLIEKTRKSNKNEMLLETGVPPKKAGPRRFVLFTIVTLLVAGAVTLAAIFLSSPAGSRRNEINGKAPGRGTSIVTAEVRPISSVLVLDANVVANPVFRIVAPADGKVVKLSDGRIGLQTANDSTAQPISLPPHSKVVGLLVASETTVKAGLPIINASYAGFALQASVPPDKIYRLYNGIISARGEITNGPGPFDATILGIPFAPGSGGSAESVAAGNQANSTGTDIQNAAGGPDGIGSAQVGDGTQGVIVVAAAPTDLRLLEGLPGLLALKTAEATGVALPVEAAAGISQRGQVYVDQKGKRVLRDVTLGITDGSYVQIKSGLRAGEKVLLPSPSIVNLK